MPFSLYEQHSLVLWTNGQEPTEKFSYLFIRRLDTQRVIIREVPGFNVGSAFSTGLILLHIFI